MIMQESLKDILSAPEWERKANMQQYAYNLIMRDISHIQLQADMRKANSADLSRFLDELCEVLSYYKN